ncbi:putative ciliary rootlet coiled-coil protein 2 isoform X9 [Durio zibethinus]|uniref:Ciliary rootlet coiled-coil protein 2 isoform X9 n=1 Tax=Durio zibethinus TaxID=66656 RepID=A0A6P6AF85_DURZI|nr:putative ciliary rootlet coiled-coil protein 2 isoform X9 [Durio zibethinus]
METTLNDNESLLARIQQLEHERDELRKDIEQLCMQQAGPSYLVVATRMHFQRTAGLEQEIESLKKKLAACSRDNQNLQEELSEAYRIKTQLADLHRQEAAKNVEAEKQVKFFQGCVASAFAERDHSIMEAEKAKEKEELMAQKFNEFQTRLEELTSNCLEQSRRNDALQIDLAKQEEENEILRKVMSKFYEIRQEAIGELEDASWDDKCTCLLRDPAEMWSFNDSSTSKYISDMLDLHISGRKSDTSEALAQALQEKVAALLLLSQQEERHLLERNVNAALQKKIDELKRNLLQVTFLAKLKMEVTNEKVKALLELAQLKRKYQLLQEKNCHEMKQGNVLAEVADRRIGTYERDGRLRNLLKKTYLRRWVGALDTRGNEAEAQPNSMDFARLRIENATLKESMESMDHLTSTLHRLRVSLLKVTESITSEGTDPNASEVLDEIITDAKLVKTALGSSLPVSWSAEGDGESIGENMDSEPGDMFEYSSNEKIDSVSAAGFEMVDLLILAAQILKERTPTASLSGS